MLTRDEAMELARHVLVAVRAQLQTMRGAPVPSNGLASYAREGAFWEAIGLVNYLVAPGGEPSLADIVDVWVQQQPPPLQEEPPCSSPAKPAP